MKAENFWQTLGLRVLTFVGSLVLGLQTQVYAQEAKTKTRIAIPWTPMLPTNSFQGGRGCGRLENWPLTGAASIIRV